MKRIVATIIAIIYLSFSVGATVHLHYCMGEYVGSSFFDFRDKACSNCGMDKHADVASDCCKDISVTVKSDDAHTYTSLSYDFVQHIAIIPSQLVESTSSIRTLTAINAAGPDSPPRSALSLFIQYHNFRI